MTMQDLDSKGVPATDLQPCASPQAALERMLDIYGDGLATLQRDFEGYAQGTLQTSSGGACYPYLCVSISEDRLHQHSNLAYGKVSMAGMFGTSVTAPELFSRYLLEQLNLLVANHGAQLLVGRSTTPIPLTFALERATSSLTGLQRSALKSFFALPDLSATHDQIVDGTRIQSPGTPMPLSLFDAQRVDYSLHRLRHYCATDAEHFQQFVLFTNYQRYVDEFIAYGHSQLAAGRYDRFVEPGNRISTPEAACTEPPLAKQPQMPAYHLVRADRSGITLVNIGVGPSNAKTITDHLAVLRPHVWLMVGHCGGLRASQRLGDYVLAHAYLRDDNVLDQALPTAIPLPTIAEVQLALTHAVGDITGLSGSEMKNRLRTGTVVTTGDRNWELRHAELALRFNQSRAIAIDMESATIAANGYRYRVPYGTLLCVSDRPLHGEIKLPGMADVFYEESVSQHLRIGIRALELLDAEAKAGTLHSRKLRSFDEPAFR